MSHPVVGKNRIAFEGLARLAAATFLRELELQSRVAMNRRYDPSGQADLTQHVIDMRKVANDALTNVVIAERLDGTSWQVVANALGIEPGHAQRQFESAEHRFIERVVLPVADDGRSLLHKTPDERNIPDQLLKSSREMKELVAWFLNNSPDKNNFSPADGESRTGIIELLSSSSPDVDANAIHAERIASSRRVVRSLGLSEADNNTITTAMVKNEINGPRFWLHDDRTLSGIAFSSAAQAYGESTHLTLAAVIIDSKSSDELAMDTARPGDLIVAVKSLVDSCEALLRQAVVADLQRHASYDEIAQLVDASELNVSGEVMIAQATAEFERSVAVGFVSSLVSDVELPEVDQAFVDPYDVAVAVENWAQNRVRTVVMLPKDEVFEGFAASNLALLRSDLDSASEMIQGLIDKNALPAGISIDTATRWLDGLHTQGLDVDFEIERRVQLEQSYAAPEAVLPLAQTQRRFPDLGFY